ncbi:hypothetical protein EGW47_00420 [Enterococcus faecium]|nr:hypothetical protein EGW27_00420 [Enterococcus faecium]ROX90408.1 hypothetical protein EGW47_00420 [Enterococcus faecium]
MRNGYTKSSFQIDVLDDSILSEFLYICFFLQENLGPTENSISPRNYRAIFLRLIQIYCSFIV